MNFLAHLFLSGDNDDIKIGNFMGDFVKGSQGSERFPKDVWQGVLLHRRIDHFTDNHSIVEQSKIRLRPNYHHYAPVIVDMYYDHFLAANWSAYSDVDLRSYTEGFYDIAWSNRDVLPAKVVNLLTHMSATNWLFHYQYLEGIDNALTGMSRRTSFDSGMERAVNDLQEHYDLFQDEFTQFFPQLIAECQND